MDSPRAWVYFRLSRVRDIGPVLLQRALAAFGAPEAVLAADPARLAQVEGIGTKRMHAFRSAPSIEQAAQESARAAEIGVRLICREDAEWPPGLRNIPDPPAVLYVRGRLLPADAVALGIVGARNCSYYGREQAQRFGALLAGAGLTVVSGGARGIDTGAHLGALQAKGRTIVVQGCGMAHTYPPENQGLYDRIVAEDRGAILSELPLDEPPQRENFLPRNRIIAGMSLGVLVIEANLRSGSLTTARLAADDYGREVFALPGRADSPTSAGTHHLIKTGSAHLVDSLDDILDALGDVGAALRSPAPAAPATPDPQPALFATGGPAVTPVQQQILAVLEGEMSIDELVERSGLPAPTVMAELTFLQLRGYIARVGAHRFTRKRQV